MAQNQYLNYYIHLTDAAVVEAKQAQFPGGVIRAPGGTGAQIEFAAPLQLDGTPFSPPCIRSPYFTGGANYPVDVATFTRTSGGWFGFPPLFGDTTHFFWVGHFVYTPLIPDLAEPDPDDPDAAEPPLSQRRWIDGFELPPSSSGPSGEGGQGQAGALVSRAASRTVDGFGLAFRHDIVTKTHTVMEYRGGGTSISDWSRERIYVTPCDWQDSGEVQIWLGEWETSAGGGGAGKGIALRVAPTGQLLAYVIAFSPTETLIGVGSALPLNVRSKLDLVFGWTDPGTAQRDAHLRVYLNGVVALDVSGKAWHQDEAYQFVHKQSVIGTTVANTLEIDVDDWVSADCPLSWPGSDEDPPTADPGIGFRTPNYAALERQADFKVGSHMQLVRPSVFAADHNALWLGDVRALLQNPIEQTGGTLVTLTTSTASARLSVVTDASQSITAHERSLGAAAIVVGLASSNTTVDGQLGYKVGAAAEVLATVPELASMGWTSVLYAPSGVTVPAPIESLALIHVKGAAADASVVRNLSAVAELIGTWGEEDLPPGVETEIRRVGIHNAPYPRTPWALPGQAPQSPVVIVGGLYTGNSTGQDVPLRVQPHWLCVRPITGTILGWHWWSSMLAAHQALLETPDAKMLPGVMIDPSFVGTGLEDAQETQAIIRIAGANQQSNAAGVVYQYIAVCDPGGRFMLNGAFGHDNAVLTAIANLHDTALPPVEPFTPEAAFFQTEVFVGGATNRHYFKGLGHPDASLSELSAVAPITAATFGEGTITTEGVVLHLDASQQVAYSAWRRDDGSGDVGVRRVVGLVQWGGTGVNPRTITVLPAVDRRPLFVVVKPANAAAVYRDPSHTGTTSQNIAGTSIAVNGISAGGIGSFEVGSQLNAAGIIYDAFILWGGTEACENGWSCNGEFAPVEPTIPTTWPAIDPPTTDPGGDGDGDGDGDEDDDGQDLPTFCDDLEEAACIAPTTLIVNLALSRIGINLPIVGLACENPQSAAEAAVQLHYDLSLQQTLRDLPWPFATRYATLTLLGGSTANPTNGDWTYRYALPSNCLYARRLVTDRGTAVNPTPPPFRLGGGVLYTNQPEAQLEFTARVACPARVGDATFRSAWAWRLAAELAPPLTRMSDQATHCVEMYEHTLETARTFLRLGNPGVPPAVDVEDPDSLCPSVKLQVINLALIRLGARTMAGLTEQSREAVSAALVYEDELRATLRDFAWPFATRYVDPLILVAGTAAAPAVPDWYFSYRAPTDMLFARRIVNPLLLGGTGRAFDQNPVPFRVGSDSTGLLIYTNTEDAVLEYTLRIDCALEVGDSMFRDAVAWRLAAALAPAVAAADPEAEEQTGRAPKSEVKDPRPSESGKVRRGHLRETRQEQAWRMYLFTLNLAKAASANESRPEQGGDASWITGRS